MERDRKIFSCCHLTISDSIPENIELCQGVTKLDFKILRFKPMVIERHSVSGQDIVQLADYLSQVPRDDNGSKQRPEGEMSDVEQRDHGQDSKQTFKDEMADVEQRGYGQGNKQKPKDENGYVEQRDHRQDSKKKPIGEMSDMEERDHGQGSKQRHKDKMIDVKQRDPRPGSKKKPTDEMSDMEQRDHGQGSKQKSKGEMSDIEQRDHGLGSEQKPKGEMSDEEQRDDGQGSKQKRKDEMNDMEQRDRSRDIKQKPKAEMNNVEQRDHVQDRKQKLKDKMTDVEWRDHGQGSKQNPEDETGDGEQRDHEQGSRQKPKAEISDVMRTDHGQDRKQKHEGEMNDVEQRDHGQGSKQKPKDEMADMEQRDQDDGQGSKQKRKDKMSDMEERDHEPDTKQRPKDEMADMEQRDQGLGSKPRPNNEMTDMEQRDHRQDSKQKPKDEMSDEEQRDDGQGNKQIQKDEMDGMKQRDHGQSTKQKSKDEMSDMKQKEHRPGSMKKSTGEMSDEEQRDDGQGSKQIQKDEMDGMKQRDHAQSTKQNSKDEMSDMEQREHRPGSKKKSTGEMSDEEQRSGLGRKQKCKNEVNDMEQRDHGQDRKQKLNDKMTDMERRDHGQRSKQNPKEEMSGEEQRDDGQGSKQKLKCEISDVMHTDHGQGNKQKPEDEMNYVEERDHGPGSKQRAKDEMNDMEQRDHGQDHKQKPKDETNGMEQKYDEPGSKQKLKCEMSDVMHTDHGQGNKQKPEDEMNYAEERDHGPGSKQRAKDGTNDVEQRDHGQDRKQKPKDETNGMEQKYDEPGSKQRPKDEMSDMEQRGHGQGSKPKPEGEMSDEEQRDDGQGSKQKRKDEMDGMKQRDHGQSTKQKPKDEMADKEQRDQGQGHTSLKNRDYSREIQHAAHEVERRTDSKGQSQETRGEDVYESLERQNVLNSSQKGNLINNSSESEEDVHETEGLKLKTEYVELARRYLDCPSFPEGLDIHVVDVNGGNVTLKVKKKIMHGSNERKVFSEWQKLSFEEVSFHEDKDTSLQQALTNIQKHWPKQVSVVGNKINIVDGDRQSVRNMKQKILELLGNQDKATHWSAKQSMDSASVITRQETSGNYGKDTKIASTTPEVRGGQYGSFAGVPSIQGTGARSKVHNCELDNFIDKDFRVGRHQSDDQSVASRDKYDGGNRFRGKCSNLEIQILQEDITKLRVDAIVNAANRQLQHNAGVAKVIAQAAGRRLVEDCKEFINKGDELGVTEVFVSSGGDLPAKDVLHAVGPKWKNYTDKEQCRHDLRWTVLRCLIEAVKLGASSLALPSISAAIFKVPPDVCAVSYMEAVKHFDEWNGGNKISLKKIFFVDVKDDMVNEIKECFFRNWQSSCSCQSKVKIKDFEFANKIFAREQCSRTRRQTHTTFPECGRSSFLGVGSVSSTPPRQLQSLKSYQIGSIQLNISSKPTMDLKADLVIIIGKVFDKLSGLQQFQASANVRPVRERPNCFQLLNLSKPGGKASRTIFTVFLESKDPTKLHKAFEKLTDAYQVEKVLMSAGSLVVTSSILYDPKPSWRPGKNTKNLKLVDAFSKELHECLSKLAKGHDKQLKVVTITAEEDVIPYIQGIFELQVDVRRVNKTTSPEPQIHPRRRPSPSPSPTKSRSGSYSGAYSGTRGRPSSHSQGYGSYSGYEACASGHGQSPSPVPADDNYSEPSSSPDRNKRERAISHVSSDDVDDNYAEPRLSPGMKRRGRSPSHASRDDGGDDFADMGSSVDSFPECPICRDQRAQNLTPCCKNSICRFCEKKIKALRCPFCNGTQGIVYGNQPDGRMEVTYTSASAGGYEGVGAWRIDYFFLGGIQKEGHPNPGKQYPTTTRTAFLPATKEGFHVLLLLRLAFMRRLVFTIGHSLTRSKDDVITWNDIHHKTSLQGGSHGYPDPGYIQNVIMEIANKGVRFENATEKEKADIKDFARRVKSSKY